MIPELNKIYCGDCREELKKFNSDFFDSVVTDPPYHLTTGKKGGTGEASLNIESPAGRSRISTGFMGKEWDGGDVAQRPETWSEVLRVMKPGGHLLAFGGTRTYHRMACAIDDAGFEIRDQIQWIYGQGFPKSLDVSKAMDKAAGAERKVIGERKRNGGPSGMTEDKGWHSGPMAHDDCKVIMTEAATDSARQWDGWGTALKPANEPIVLARKPLSESTVAANVLKWGTGALNIDGCRVGFEDTPNPATNPLYRKRAGYKIGNAPDTNSSSFSVKKDSAGERPANELGRWPANVIHDGSEEVLGRFPDAPGQCGEALNDGSRKKSSIYRDFRKNISNGNTAPREDATKSAARFFYCAKTSQAERGEGNTHPTVKPISLMAYLIRLITPPKGIVLDPFLGSGSTSLAAIQEGNPWVGIELLESHVAIAQARIDAETEQGKLF